MSKSSLISAVVGAAITAAAFLLNPSAERHREAISQAVSERAPVGGLGLGGLVALVPEYRSYGLLSLTRFQDRTVSVGAFGMVYVLRNSKA